jgi:hypothetical protein
MKKRKNKTKTPSSKKNIWTGIAIVILLLAALSTAIQTQSPYSVAMGVLIGFLVSTLSNKLNN